MTTRLHIGVKNILARHGYAVTFTRKSVGGSYNATTGKVAGGSDSTISGRGIYLSYGDDEIDGTSILSGDRKLLVQAVSLSRAPVVGDVADSEFRILNVREYKSGDTVIAYTCQVRK